MLDSSDTNADFDESIFDRVNSEYTKEYEAYVQRVDQLLGLSAIFKNVGDATNQARLLSWTVTYNKNIQDTDAEATKIRLAGRKNFTMAHCYNDRHMFWNFLKTSHQFMKSAWYFKEYMVEKLLGKRTVDVESILIIEDIRHPVDIQVESSIKIPWENGEKMVSNICENDRNVIGLYFRANDRGPLCKKMYNWFRRRLSSYKIYLTILFPPIKHVILELPRGTKVITTQKKKLRGGNNLRDKQKNPSIENLGYNAARNVVTELTRQDQYNVNTEDTVESLPIAISESQLLELGTIIGANKVNKRIISIDIESEAIITLLNQWTDDLREQILIFLDHAEHIGKS